jgi:heavy metal translocating P-type ATPase
MMTKEIQDKKNKLLLKLNYLLCFVLVGALLLYWLKIPLFREEKALIVISVAATLTVFLGALRSIKEKRVSVDLLASIALVVSLVEKEWVSAIFINLMVASARTFSEYVKISSHSAINALLKLKPEMAKIKKDGRIERIPVKDVKIGDLVIVELGEKVPIDGVVEDGEAEIDQSSLAGESNPVQKGKGDQVLSFTTVISGNLIIRAEKVGGETMFEKIISLIGQSQQNKAPIYSLINKFANWYIILTILGALIVYLISKNITLVLGLLLISCADDIAVATPLALMSAITHSAKHGAIVKGGDFLEALAKVKIVVFDKTGTLTRGRLKIENIFSFFGDNREILKFAAIVSSFSNHPIAKTIVREAQKEKISIPTAESFEEYSARGMTAVFKNKTIVTGKLSFLEKMGVKITGQQITRINEEITGGHNVTLLGYDNELIGFIVLADEIRPEAKKTIQELKKLNIKKIAMLTGDNERVAQKTAALLEIDEFHANLLPEDKLAYLKKYLSKKYKVAMVGDGVNDAPVLALSDVGIAMGAIGSDAAIETADVAMMKDNISQIPELIKISRVAIGVIQENLVIWGIVNIIGFSLVFLHVLTPAGAAFYNFATDFIPILNSLRLFR